MNILKKYKYDSFIIVGQNNKFSIDDLIIHIDKVIDKKIGSKDFVFS